MLRGQYDKPGEKVEPGTPAVLPPLQQGRSGDRATRLDLAHWLVAPENPLTARVTVNRLWQQFFGTGLVKTERRLRLAGRAAEPSRSCSTGWPSTFRESGWDVKALVRLMVTSATFRQSSQVTPELLAARSGEPAATPAARASGSTPSRSATTRCSSAACSTSTMGGKGVKPYQPPNIWEPVGFAGSNTRFYKQDTGAALYRRSLYTFLKRTAPPPFMTNFDAPNREQFCTPPRAQQHAAAGAATDERRAALRGRPRPRRADADARAARRPPTASRSRFRVVLARTPEADELAIVQDQFGKHLARFVRRSRRRRRRSIRVGESQAEGGHCPSPSWPRTRWSRTCS